MIKTTIDCNQQHCCENCGETPHPQTTTVPNGAASVDQPELLISVYPAPPRGADSFHRWPVPLKQLRVDSDENIPAYLLDLLREGGPGSYVQVEILTQ